MGLRLARLITPTVTDENQTEAGLLVARDKVRRYMKRLKTTAVDIREEVKELIQRKKKSKALIGLRKLIYVEEGVRACEEQLLQLEKVALQIGESRTQKEVFDAMRAGTDLLQRIDQRMSVDDAQQLVEDTEAAYAYQQELDSILVGSSSKDEALLQELNSPVPSGIPASLQVSTTFPALAILPA